MGLLRLETNCLIGLIIPRPDHRNANALLLQSGNISDLLGPVILAETLALDHDPVAHAPGHLVFGDQQVPAAL